MKAWKSKGEWFHKSSGKTHRLEFAVLADDSEDPIEIIKKTYDMGGMTYLRGEVVTLDLPVAISLR
jgi:hypothetical protein